MPFDPSLCPPFPSQIGMCLICAFYLLTWLSLSTHFRCAFSRRDETRRDSSPPSQLEQGQPSSIISIVSVSAGRFTNFPPISACTKATNMQ
uniref:Uncharacterized protein n=1 Tax=Physcomitrium patens TaxID=3218 RepID=A0A2K1JE76_PHYPA|nr:hypothetical protein PHYPA_020112 [Physcomitrium patens]